jgi:3-phenylpropionate/trans-cinnamate dioxygenase ferredoxin subunit
MPFAKACNSNEIEDGRSKCVTLNGKRIALFRVNEKLHAIDDTCTHDEASLAEGTVIEENGKCVVECPWHGAHFDLCTGAALTLPAVTPVKAYIVREANGTIEVDL